MDFDTDIKPILTGQVRHLATVAGTALVSNGWLTTDRQSAFVQAVVGIVLVLGSMLWSGLQKRLQADATARKIETTLSILRP